MRSVCEMKVEGESERGEDAERERQTTVLLKEAVAERRAESEEETEMGG